MRKFKKT